MNMQTAIKKLDEAIAAWGPNATEAEIAAIEANPLAYLEGRQRKTPEEYAADEAESDRLMAADVAAQDAAAMAPCRCLEDVLAGIDFVVRDDFGDLDETVSGILSRCAEYLRGQVSRGAANEGCQ